MKERYRLQRTQREIQKVTVKGWNIINLGRNKIEAVTWDDGLFWNFLNGIQTRFFYTHGGSNLNELFPD